MTNLNIDDTNTEFDPNYELQNILIDAKHMAAFLSSFALGFANVKNPFDLSGDEWLGLHSALRNQADNLERAEKICEAYKAKQKKPLLQKERAEQILRDALSSAEKIPGTDSDLKNQT